MKASEVGKVRKRHRQLVGKGSKQSLIRLKWFGSNMENPERREIGLSLKTAARNSVPAGSTDGN